MADTTSTPTDFSSLFGSVLNWANQNPQLAGAAVGGIGTLLDPAQASVNTTQNQVSLPSYAAPYVGRLLNQYESLAQMPYQPYSGQRVADMNATQNQAISNIANQQTTSPYQTQGAGIVGQAANQMLQNAGQTWNQQAAQQYMNPYQQDVTDIAKSELQRQYDIQQPAVAAQAVKQGAFGGDRQAILQAENQRNLNQQMNQLQMQGSNAAYQNAQNMFNQDLSRNNQALQGTTWGAQALSGIGQQGIQNQMANNQYLLGAGNLQQQNTQQGLNVGYQNFQNQVAFPYQQAQFMQSGLQGLPMSQYTTAQFGSTPTLTQQLIGSGIGGYLAGNSTTGP